MILKPLLPFAILVLSLALATPPALADDDTDFDTQIAALETQYGGQIGVAALDTATGQRLAYRETERFALSSTFKMLLAAAVLSRVDAESESLSRAIPFDNSDILDYAPITSARLAEGAMSISDLCAAAIEYSDNTAANLLLETLGGPAGLTAYLRALDDETTRIDRIEPDLNSNTPGDERDTTTPEAMLAIMNKLLVGNALQPDSRNQLITWLVNNTTGDARIRAGLDPSWKVGDKTGTGSHGATSDIAIAWPNGSGKPILIAIYYTGSTKDIARRNAVIAQIARLIASALGHI